MLESQGKLQSMDSFKPPHNNQNTFDSSNTEKLLRIEKVFKWYTHAMSLLPTNVERNPEFKYGKIRNFEEAKAMYAISYKNFNKMHKLFERLKNCLEKLHKNVIDLDRSSQLSEGMDVRTKCDRNTETFHTSTQNSSIDDRNILETKNMHNHRKLSLKKVESSPVYTDDEICLTTPISLANTISMPRTYATGIVNINSINNEMCHMNTKLQIALSDVNITIKKNAQSSFCDSKEIKVEILDKEGNSVVKPITQYSYEDNPESLFSVDPSNICEAEQFRIHFNDITIFLKKSITQELMGDSDMTDVKYGCDDSLERKDIAQDKDILNSSLHIDFKDDASDTKTEQQEVVPAVVKDEEMNTTELERVEDSEKADIEKVDKPEAIINESEVINEDAANNQGLISALKVEEESNCSLKSDDDFDNGTTYHGSSSPSDINDLTEDEVVTCQTDTIDNDLKLLGTVKVDDFPFSTSSEFDDSMDSTDSTPLNNNEVVNVGTVRNIPLLPAENIVNECRVVISPLLREASKEDELRSVESSDVTDSEESQHRKVTNVGTPVEDVNPTMPILTELRVILSRCDEVQGEFKGFSKEELERRSVERLLRMPSLKRPHMSTAKEQVKMFKKRKVRKISTSSSSESQSEDIGQKSHDSEQSIVFEDITSSCNVYAEPLHALLDQIRNDDEHELSNDDSGDVENQSKSARKKISKQGSESFWRKRKLRKISTSSSSQSQSEDIGQKSQSKRNVRKISTSSSSQSQSEDIWQKSHAIEQGIVIEDITFSCNVYAEPLYALLDQIRNDDEYELSNDDSDDVENQSKSARQKITKDKLVEKLKTFENNWRNDPLLKERLCLPKTDSSGSDSEGLDENGILKKSETQRIKKQRNVQENRKKSSLRSGSETPSDLDIPHSTPATVLSSSEESDIEFIEESHSSNEQTIQNNKSDVFNISSEEDNQKKTGRKNIRAVLTDDILEENTKRANEEEEARKLRLSEKHKQLETFNTQSSYSQEDSLVLDVDASFKKLVTVHPTLSRRLKPHQQEGVKFMWDACYESVKQLKTHSGSGCILAHCMGLGKTFQVVTLIHTLFTHPETNTKHVLVVCPLSTVLNWKNEFHIGLQEIQEEEHAIKIFAITDKNKSRNQKLHEVDEWWKRTGVLIMGYEAYLSLVKLVNDKDINITKLHEALITPGPDLFVCDEGHLLKNGKNNRCQALSKIQTRRRIVMTGTPLQNNLTEYYHMLQFVKPNLLGSYKEYSNRFVNPITNGQFHDSTAYDIHLMKKRSHVLHKLLEKTIQRYEVSELQQYLPKKWDYVVFIRLTQLQSDLYERYYENTLAAQLMMKSHLFLHYHNLQHIWTHPILLDLKEKQKNRQKIKVKEIDTIDLEPEIKDTDVPAQEGWWKEHCPKNLASKIEYGNKFLVMRSIIDECEKIGDKTLIFSSSIPEMDAIEMFLKSDGTSNTRHWVRGLDYYRLDGTVAPDVRIKLCNEFNDKRYQRVKAFLISHRVGGLGLNLVAANRVILMDVSWNPSYDSQSIFRTYRFGQTKECFVYRLVTKGTIEETMYNRQINKLAIAGRVVDERQISRHYKSHQLQILFKFNDDLQLERPIPMIPADNLLASLLQTYPKQIFNYHEHQTLLENLPHEKLDDAEMKLAWEEFNKEKEMSLQPPVTTFTLQTAIPSEMPPNVQDPQTSSCGDFISPSSPKETNLTFALAPINKAGGSDFKKYQNWKIVAMQSSVSTESATCIQAAHAKKSDTVPNTSYEKNRVLQHGDVIEIED